MSYPSSMLNTALLVSAVVFATELFRSCVWRGLREFEHCDSAVVSPECSEWLRPHGPSRMRAEKAVVTLTPTVKVPAPTRHGPFHSCGALGVAMSNALGCFVACRLRVVMATFTPISSRERVKEIVLLRMWAAPRMRFRVRGNQRALFHWGTSRTSGPHVHPSVPGFDQFLVLVVDGHSSAHRNPWYFTRQSLCRRRILHCIRFCQQVPPRALSRPQYVSVRR